MKLNILLVLNFILLLSGNSIATEAEFVGESYITKIEGAAFFLQKEQGSKQVSIRNSLGTSLYVESKIPNVNAYKVKVVNPDGSFLNNGEQFIIWGNSLNNYFVFSEALELVDEAMSTTQKINASNGGQVECPDVVIASEYTSNSISDSLFDETFAVQSVIPSEGDEFVDWLAENLEGGYYKFGKSRPISKSDLTSMCKDINLALKGELPEDGFEGSSNCSTASWIGFLLRMKKNRPDWIENNQSDLGCRMKDGKFAGWSRAYSKYISDFPGFVKKYIKKQNMGEYKAIATKNLTKENSVLEAGDVIVLNRTKSPCGKKSASGHAVIFDEIQEHNGLTYICYWSSQSLSNSCKHSDPAAASEANNCCKFATRATAEGYGKRCESTKRLNAIALADINYSME